MRLTGNSDHLALRVIAPTLIAHGSGEQCARHLGPMVRGDEAWCLLVSDLAAAPTQVRGTTDGFVVSGRKRRVPAVPRPDFGLLLAWTDPAGAEREALTAFVVPMHAPGVTVCAPREVAFDDVLLVPSAVLGAIGKGWAVMLTALGFARASHPSPRARSGTRCGKIGACDGA